MSQLWKTGAYRGKILHGMWYADWRITFITSAATTYTIARNYVSELQQIVSDLFVEIKPNASVRRD